jgi:hypothetical protein
VAVEVDRVVNASGLVGLAGRYVSVGQVLAGRRVTLRLEGDLGMSSTTASWSAPCPRQCPRRCAGACTACASPLQTVPLPRVRCG